MSCLRFTYHGKELDEETGYYYYGARYYNPQISSWLSVDPLAEKYPSISPYAYVANNPIKFIDPDGREIINADRLRLAKRKAAYEKYKSSGNYQKYNGLTRKQVKNQYGKSGLAAWRNVNRRVKNYEKTISTYESRANRTDAIMKQWKKESPNLYKKVDEMSVDFYLGVDEHVSSGKVGEPFGGTGSPTCGDGKYVYKVNDLGVEGALPVFINSGVNIDSIDEETGEYSLNHEAGHFIFAVENPDEYENDKMIIEVKGEDYQGGHHPDATTGKEAAKYGKEKDIK